MRALLVLLTCLPMFGFAKTAQQVFSAASRSVVIVESQRVRANAPPEILARGSGVVVAKNRVLTNCHIVENGDLVGVRPVGGSRVRPLIGTVVSQDVDADLCLVKVSQLNILPAEIGSAARLRIGDTVYAIGAPRGLELSLSDGLVAQLRGSSDAPIIQTTAPISPGSSGGGLFDGNGRLVGITSFFVKDGQNLNFAMPIEWLAELQELERKKRLHDTGKSESKKPSGSLSEMLPVIENDFGVWHLRTSTVRVQPNGHVRAWTVINLPDGPRSRALTSRSRATLYDFDCVERRSADLAHAAYTEPFASGKTIMSFTVAEREIQYTYATPDTPSELLLVAACHVAGRL